MELGVYCECGRCLPVAKEDAGGSLTCSCGRPVVVPLLEEFRQRPRLLSAPTLERRIQRLIAEGELPGTDACVRCGEPKGARAVIVRLECERTWVRKVGGSAGVLITPWFYVVWEGTEEVETHGRDTDYSLPLVVCPDCRRLLGGMSRTTCLAVAAPTLVISLLLAFFSWALVVAVFAVAFVLLWVVANRAARRQQRVVKNLLRGVPVYRQLLERYPRATAVLRE
jgi:hypothetical protein